MSRILGLEPALIIGLVTSTLALLVTFGVPLSDMQQETIKAFAVALLPVLAALITRQQVIPVAKVEAAHGVEGVKAASKVTAKDLEHYDAS